MPSPEELARENIGALLKQCGWLIQTRSEINLSACRLTATPSKQTIGFPNKNLVMDWSSSDKTLSAGKARRVRAGSANGASRTAVRHRHAIAWAKPEKRRLRVNQYGHERASAHQVNVNYDVYKIETEITKGGSRVEALRRSFGIKTLATQRAIHARKQAALPARSTKRVERPEQCASLFSDHVEAAS